MVPDHVLKRRPAAPAILRLLVLCGISRPQRTNIPAALTETEKSDHRPGGNLLLYSASPESPLALCRKKLAFLRLSDGRGNPGEETVQTPRNKTRAEADQNGNSSRGGRGEEEEAAALGGVPPDRRRRTYGRRECHHWRWNKRRRRRRREGGGGGGRWLARYSDPFPFITDYWEERSPASRGPFTPAP